MKKFVAIAKEGAEYMYKPRTAHAVPASRASIICEMLNSSRYMLKDGEKWRVYNCGSGQVYAETQKFSLRSGKLIRYGS